MNYKIFTNKFQCTVVDSFIDGKAGFALSIVRFSHHFSHGESQRKPTVYNCQANYMGVCIMNERIIYVCQVLIDKLLSYMVKQLTMFSSNSFNNSITTTAWLSCVGV